MSGKRAVKGLPGAKRRDAPAERARLRPGGPLAAHTLQCVATLTSHGAQIASIIHSDPFVLVYEHS